MKFFIVSFFLALAATSMAQTVKNKTITLEPYMSFENYEHFTRLTLSSSDSPIEYLEGFEFAWGYKYTLNVQETELSEWLSDGTRYEYSFNKVISKTKVPDSTEFKLYLNGKRYYYELDSSEEHMNNTLTPINDSTYLYFEEVEIEVPDALKLKFEEIVSGKARRVGWFNFIDDKRIRLVHW